MSYYLSLGRNIRLPPAPACPSPFPSLPAPSIPVSSQTLDVSIPDEQDTLVRPAVKKESKNRAASLQS